MAAVILAGRVMARLGPLCVWAENGLVRWVNEADGQSDTLSWQAAAERTLALSDSLNESKRHEKNYAYIPAWCELADFVNDASKVIQLAKEQGAPDDASAARDKARRRPTWHVVPANLTI